MENKLLEPLRYYEEQGKEEHRNNTLEYLNSLIAQSGVNINENRATVARIKEENQKLVEVSKKLSKYKTFRILLVIAAVFGVIMTLASFGMFSDSVGSGIFMLLLGGGGAMAAIWALIKKVNPVIKDTTMIIANQKAVLDNLENTAWMQMNPLNSLFTDDDAVKLIEKTLPDFKFHKNFLVSNEKLFAEKYDFYDLQDEECSMIDTLSGTYAGNPFLFGRRRMHRMGTHTYKGSLKITWVETYTDSDGNVQTKEKSQTLSASVTKPKPYYSTNTFLAYGNQAAPNLEFSRCSKHSENLSEKALEKKIKRGEHKLQKKTEKAIKHGETFQEMANSEFEVLFDATDRDNEMEFRLMYTPIGQRSTVALLKDSKNYGDDFDFIKKGKFNVIMSDHAQNWKMGVYARDYVHYDYEEISSKFVSLNEKYFKSIFFDFAPLFSVPAYLEESCAALDYDYEYPTNYTCYEHEVMANAIGNESLAHEDSATEAILKTQFMTSDNGIDVVLVTAYSYIAFERVDYIPVKGGDGNYHNVPVPWIEYIPVSKATPIVVGDDSTITDDDSIHYHGMSTEILKQ